MSCNLTMIFNIEGLFGNLYVFPRIIMVFFIVTLCPAASSPSSPPLLPALFFYPYTTHAHSSSKTHRTYNTHITYTTHNNT